MRLPPRPGAKGCTWSLAAPWSRATPPAARESRWPAVSCLRGL